MTNYIVIRRLQQCRVSCEVLLQPWFVLCVTTISNICCKQILFDIRKKRVDLRVLFKVNELETAPRSWMLCFCGARQAERDVNLALFYGGVQELSSLAVVLFRKTYSHASGQPRCCILGNVTLDLKIHLCRQKCCIFLKETFDSHLQDVTCVVVVVKVEWQQTWQRGCSGPRA